MDYESILNNMRATKSSNTQISTQSGQSVVLSEATKGTNPRQLRVRTGEEQTGQYRTVQVRSGQDRTRHYMVGRRSGKESLHQLPQKTQDSLVQTPLHKPLSKLLYVLHPGTYE